MSKATADHGGQAALGDIVNRTDISAMIGQICGSGTVVIQNLHITAASGPATMSEAPAGLVAYFHIDQWWLETLTEIERGAIELAIGNEVARENIYKTSKTAQSWLRGIALRIGAVHPTLASKIRAKATWIDTGIETDDYWTRQLDAVRRHWQRQDYDAAREELRAVGYRMREENALPESVNAYKHLLDCLMHSDPYYTEVLAVVLPIVTSRPGVIQSTLARGCPAFDTERFRHAMYYAEMLGDIRRVKQGRSYALFP